MIFLNQSKCYNLSYNIKLTSPAISNLNLDDINNIDK